MSIERSKRPGEGTFGILLLALGLFFLWQSYSISGFEGLSSPGAFPLAASAAMVAAALVVVISDLRKPHAEDGDRRLQSRAFVGTITPPVLLVFAVFALIYAILLAPLGFLPASFLFLLAGIRFLYRGSFIVSLVLSALLLIAVYALFRLVFQVVLPEGIVPEREILAWLERLFAGGA